MANNAISILIEAKDNATLVLQRLGSEVKQAGNALEEAAPKSDRFESALGVLGSRLRFVAETFAIYKVGQAISDFATSSVAAAGELEQTNMSFQSLIGNAKEANQLFGQLVQYANTTPFQAKDVTSAAKQLLAFGETAKQVTENVKQLGDVTAAGGGDLQALALVTGQVFAQGKMRAQDMYQVINDGGAGLIKIMAANVGGMQKLTSEFDSGGIPAKQYFDAITQATSKGGFAFEGALKQAHTLNGQLSTLKDAATQFGEALIGVHTDPNLGLTIQPGGLFDRMKTAVGGLSNVLQDIGPAAGRGMASFIGWVGESVKSAELFFRSILNWNIVMSDFKILMHDVAQFFNKEYIPAVRELVRWYRELPPVVQFAINPIVAFAVNIHNLTGFVRSLIVEVHSMYDAFKQSTPVIIIGQYIQQVFIPALKAIWAAVAQNLLPALGQLWDSLVRLYNALEPALTQALKIIGAIIGGLLLAAIWLVTAALNILVQVLSFVISIVSNLINWLSNLVSWFGNLIATTYNVARGMLAIFANLAQGTKDALGFIISIFAGLGGMILHALGDLGSLLYNAGRSLIGGLVHGITDSFASVGSSVVGGLKGILHAAHIPGFAGGGFTGIGGSNEVAGIVHKGEYVLPQSMVDQRTGRPKALGGAGGATVNIENLNVSNDMDLRRVIRDIGWRLQTA